MVTESEDVNLRDYNPFHSFPNWTPVLDFAFGAGVHIIGRRTAKKKVSNGVLCVSTAFRKIALILDTCERCRSAH